MAKGGGKRTYVRDGRGRFASTPGSAAKKAAKSTSGRTSTLGARTGLKGSRAKLKAKDKADQTLQTNLSTRAQKGAVTRGSRKLAAAKVAAQARISGGRKGVIGKPKGLKPGMLAARRGVMAKAAAKPAKAKAPSAPKINGKEWTSLSRLRGAVPFDRGRGQTGYFIPGSSLTPAKRNKLGLGAFKSEVNGGNFTAQRHTQGSQEGWIISPRTQRGETPVQVQRSKSSKKPKTASDLLTQATRIEVVGRRMSRAARTGVRDRQIEARAVRAAKAARQRAFDMQKPPSKSELKRQEQRLNSRTTAGLNARLARDYAARNRR